MSHYCVECPRSLNALDIHAVGRPTRDWDIQEVLMYKALPRVSLKYNVLVQFYL